MRKGQRQLLLFLFIVLISLFTATFLGIKFTVRKLTCDKAKQELAEDVEKGKQELTPIESTDPPPVYPPPVTSENLPPKTEPKKRGRPKNPTKMQDMFCGQKVKSKRKENLYSFKRDLFLLFLL
jgi:hypothetical protein